MASVTPARCPSCQSERPANAVDSLCPRCLLRNGLESDALSLSRSGELGATIDLAGPPRVLETLAASLGLVPRVLLRDTDPDTEPPLARPSSPEMPPTEGRPDRLRLLGEIARGGMGAVLKGRDENLGRDLAVKVLLEKHRENPDLVRRFVEEAQIGGQLQHPGIVPIYELGAFVDRRPYFAMKLVKGQTLAELLSARSSPTDGLPRFLGIFEQIAQTVAYAHARGVIHRDLKPSNIMVGGFGEVQVMDWGLAKVLPRGGVIDDHEAGKTPEADTPEAGTLIATARSGSDSDAEHSRAGSVMGTPAYMAPEQARGEVDAVDERADVFALGSILVEILTGQPAYIGRSSLEVLRLAAHGETSEALARLEDCGADADLVSLTHACLAIEPEDRPKTAGAVSARVTAYLVGVQEKLHASERERAVAEARAVEERRKRKWQLGLAASIAASLLIGGIGLAGFAAILNRQKGELAQANVNLTRQTRRAEVNEAAAIDAVKRFRDSVAENPELKDNPELDSLRKTLLKEPLAFFRSLRQRLQEDDDARPESLLRLALAIHEYAHLTDEIGDPGDGLKSHDDSLAIWERLVQTNPDDPDYQAGLATIQDCRGGFLRSTGRVAEARSAYEAALAIRQQLVADHPNVTAYQSNLAGSQHNLGNLLKAIGRPAGAKAAFEAALAIGQKLVADHPDVTTYQKHLANYHNNHGILLFAIGRPAEAKAAYEAALTIGQKLAADYPNVTVYQEYLAHSHNNLGNLLFATGRPAEAKAAYEAALAIRQQLVADHPNVTAYQNSLATCHNNLGNLLRAIGRPAEAKAAFEAALAIGQRISADHPNITAYQNELANCHNNLGNLLSETGRPAEAKAAFEAALAIGQKLAADHPNIAIYQSNLAGHHNNLGILLLAIGRPAEAKSACETALAIGKKLASDHPESPHFADIVGVTLSNLAEIDLKDREFTLARDRLREAISWQKKTLAANPRNPVYRQHLRSHYQNLLLAARGLHDADLAAQAQRGLAEPDGTPPLFPDLDARLTAVLTGDPPKDNAERLALAERAHDTRRYAAAARLWAEAIEADPSLVDSPHTPHRYNAACCASLAADGQDVDDPKPDDATRAKLRSQALGWLESDLRAWKRVALTAELGNKPLTASTLAHWQQDADLASVWDAKALEAIPEPERARWQALWTEVETLRAKASKAANR